MKDRHEELRIKSAKQKTAAPHKGGGAKVRATTRLVKVRHLDAPPRVQKPKRIHARHVLPFVTEGEERNVHSLNVRAMIARPQDATQDIQIVLNTPLTQPPQNRTATWANPVFRSTGMWFFSPAIGTPPYRSMAEILSSSLIPTRWPSLMILPA